ncbi:MAG: alpha/beta hydrolase [Dehalococcoidia bacterium]
MDAMEWGESREIEGGIVERRFRLARASGDVPGVLWTRGAVGTDAPLVLLGHGGGGSKTGPSQLDARDAYTGGLGMATAAIDGPAHGDRGPVTDSTQPEYRAMWQRPGVVDTMVEDWQATLDALLATGEFDAGAVGYHGLSMGTMFGMPLVAAEPRIAAAVLGLCGTAGSSIDRSGIGGRLAADAPRVRCPVLFHFQWDDERFTREGSLAMFDLLGTPDKRLQSSPGQHIDTPPEAHAALVSFLGGRLRARTPA